MSSAQLAQRTHGLAATIAARSPVAIRRTKTSLNRAEWLPLKEAYQLEQDYTEKLRGCAESRKAMLAFVAGDAH